MKKFRVNREWAARLCAGATAGFVLSLLIHVLTLFRILPFGGSKWVYLLHAGVFVFFFPMVFDQQRLRALGWRGALSLFPAWAYGLAVVLLVYLQVIGRLSIDPAGPEVAAAKDLRFLRIFSAGWLLFYLLPAIYFCYVPRRLSEPGREAA